MMGINMAGEAVLKKCLESVTLLKDAPVKFTAATRSLVMYGM